MNKIAPIIKRNIRQYGMFIVLIIMISLFQILTGGLLLKPMNLTNIVLQNSYIVILAIGMLPIIITARIDLSVGSIAAFVGAVAAIMMVQHEMGFLATLLTGIAIGAAIGAWHGFWVAIRNIPAFIVTLSSQLVFRGLTVVVLDGRSIGPFSDSFQALSSSFIPDIFHNKSMHLTTLLLATIACAVYVMLNLAARKEKDSYGFLDNSAMSNIVKLIAACIAIMGLSWFFSSHQGFPTVMIIMVALVLAYSFLTRRTIIGRHLYALGGNEKAAQLSGVKTKKVLFITFMNMGALAGLAGLIFAARLNAGTPKAGTGFELDAIAACFIGGASVTGGTGTIAGALVGCFIMGVMNNGMSIMGIPVDLQQAIKGLVILFSVAIDLSAKAKEA